MAAEENPGRRFCLPEPIADLVKARNALRERYRAAGLQFTFDGNLVGGIGLAMALEWFGVRLADGARTSVNGWTADGKSVIVRATGTGRGPAFRRGAPGNDANFLLFFDLDFETLEGEVAFNGPTRIALQRLPETWVGQRMIGPTQIREADREVPAGQRLPMVGERPPPGS